MLLAAVAISFLDVSAWKHVPARDEWIPAFRATAVNASEMDWAEARIRVVSHCAGGNRSYEVKARNLLVGRQQVEVVLYDGPASKQACEGPSEAEFLGGTPFPEDQRPSFILLGFRLEDGSSNVNTHLEGIIEHRRPSENQLETVRLYWADGGERLRLDGLQDYGVYCFRVRPGEMGIAGFLLNRDRQSEGPLTRFLRFFEVAPGKEAWLGLFDVKLGPGQLVSVTMDAKTEVVEKLRQVRSREPAATPARRPRPSSSPLSGR